MQHDGTQRQMQTQTKCPQADYRGKKRNDLCPFLCIHYKRRKLDLREIREDAFPEYQNNYILQVHIKNLKRLRKMNEKQMNTNSSCIP
jgi:hypothetical protein